MDFTTSVTPKTPSHKLDFSEGHTESHNTSQRPQRSRSRKQPSLILKLVLFICIAAAAVFGIRMLYRHIVYAGIDTTRYQAVYLTNDNVYFGKVHIQLTGDIFLTDVFRVQAASTTSGTGQNGDTSTDQTTTSTSTSSESTGDIRLIKPGKELHAPDDTMLIKRSNVLFIENLKTNGSVTQAIVDYHKQNAKNDE